MALPVTPPVEPMLARLARTLPTGLGLSYEPKWDGFRCLAFRDGAAIELRSRNQRPLDRYFPEVVEALAALPTAAFVVDGELVVQTVRGDGGYDFSALLARLHPARSRVERLRDETPATYRLFDALAVGDRDLRGEPFRERRRVLESLVPNERNALALTPTTTHADEAADWLDLAPSAGVDGVMVKEADAPYVPGKRTMTKVKRQRTLDAVVGGFRLLPERPEVSSLLLGLHDDAGALRHIGVASSMKATLRRELLAELRPYVTSLAGHPWEHGYGLEGGPIGRLMGAAGRWTPDLAFDWVPVRPVLVCEVTYEHVEGIRLRHPARFARWRPDRDPSTCRIDQVT